MQLQGKSKKIVFPRHRFACLILAISAFSPSMLFGQINTDRVLLMGRNALYYEDYVLAIQRFNMVINAKPWLGEPYFFRGLAKFYLEDYAGAEVDCSSALERNPYSANHYELRALCRINQNGYKGAEDDYRKAIEISPLDHNCRHNLVLCQMELKEFAAADSALDVMLKHWPKESMQYTLKAQVSFASADTLRAVEWLDRALEVNPYDGSAWSMKSMVYSSHKQYNEAEDALDRAILQQPRNAGLYINRALARYEQNNLRGAMSDYDAALEMEPGNYLGHFNRGLLRAQVGQDNAAIEDLNFVLEQEPDNMIVLYNRALLLDNTGDYNGALRDISAVIAEYPEFWAGYSKRAEIRRKLGDVYGAERDEFKILKAEMAVAAGTYKSSGKTRKKSEKNIEEYNKLVEEDEQETTNEYASSYRGRVQNQKTDLKPLHDYVLTYYGHKSELNSYVAYSKEVDSLNHSKALPNELLLTYQESSSSETQLQQHFDWIAAETEELEKNPSQTDMRIRRALDYYHVRDFENSIADLNNLLSEDPSHFLALFLRAQVRNAQTEVESSSKTASELRLSYLMVLQDLAKCIEKDASQAYLFYNRGCVLYKMGDYSDAIQAFSDAIQLDSKFPAAFYNRGIAHLQNKENENGLSDLSQAGELGLYSAYNLIKRYSIKKQK